MLCLSGFELYSRWVPLVQLVASSRKPTATKKQRADKLFVNLCNDLKSARSRTTALIT